MNEYIGGSIFNVCLACDIPTTVWDGIAEGTVSQGDWTRVDGDNHVIWGETICVSQGERHAPENTVYISSV